MENLKTFEEFNWKFLKKKELTPEEEYQKQKRAAEKETEEIKNKENKDYLEEEDEEDEIPNNPPINTDPYGEENWSQYITKLPDLSSSTNLRGFHCSNNRLTRLTDPL